jgi:hypothetical protein
MRSYCCLVAFLDSLIVFAGLAAAYDAFMRRAGIENNSECEEDAKFTHDKEPGARLPKQNNKWVKNYF